MRNSRLWRDLLGVEKTIVDDVEFDAEHQQLVVLVRPIKAARDRCGLCNRRCPRYDAGAGCRRWRLLDFGTGMVWLGAEASWVSRHALDNLVGLLRATGQPTEARATPPSPAVADPPRTPVRVGPQLTELFRQQQ